MPVNKNIGLEAILAAADHYFEVSGRRLTFEYVLLGGVNDEPRHAHKLAGLLRGRLALLNVIPYNPVAGLPYRAPRRGARAVFGDPREAGVNVQVRQRKGDAINAACGQLRRISTAENVAENAEENPSPPAPLPQGERGEPAPMPQGEKATVATHQQQQQQQ